MRKLTTIIFLGALSSTMLNGANPHKSHGAKKHAPHKDHRLFTEINGADTLLTASDLGEVEVFGARYIPQKKLDDISRMPLRPSEQIQSISVISDKLISQQGALNLSDAAKNVVGISTFATYGGASESLSARGYRGIPTLKNGVKVNSNFRGQGFLTDMQGVESIQMIKGSAAITQGIASDLGSGGGVINIATKTPKFIKAGEISLRVGSWGQVRPTFDYQNILDKNGTIAFRLNGAYERADSYRAHVSKDRIYINPSLEWRPNDQTTFTFEMDYLHDSRTPDRGTVNLAADSVNALYNMPHDKFTGFSTDRIYTDNLTYSARFKRRLNDNFSIRVGFFGSILDKDNTGASLSTLKDVKKTGAYNLRSRSITRSTSEDNNNALQIDFVGQDVYTWKLKHTFQAGLDFRRTATSNTAYNSVVVDTINVLESINNTLPSGISLTAKDPETATDYSYGIMLQDVITFNDYLKAVWGVRYSYGTSYTGTSAETITGDAFNPMAGIIVTPIKGLNLFASYTNSTDLRSSANLMEDGSPIGASVAQQFETGIKSDWLDNRLRFNLTLFQIKNSNLSYLIYDDNWVSTNRYAKAGELRRRGIETEISGRILPNLEVILGYAYLDAQYMNSPAYAEGSRPMNAPKHTANGWINYMIDRGVLKGLTFGAGAFYTGARPVNDYSLKATHTNTQPGVKPFDMDAFTTVNAKVGYQHAHFGVNVFFNNITSANGYSSYYRGGYINPIDPFNMGAQVTYRF
ncbi:MAG: TonB-dependent siderophore receptor [Bacteroidales bacterium]